MGEVIDIRRFVKVQDCWMDKRALASYWNCSRRTIDNYLAQGMLMKMRAGKRQIMLSEAERWYEDAQRDDGAI